MVAIRVEDIVLVSLRYDLTYESCQDSHKYDRMYAELAAGMPGMTDDDVKELFRRDT